jgi:hypothetical protein
MPWRGDKPREPRPGVYRPGQRPVNTRRVFTGLIRAILGRVAGTCSDGWNQRRMTPYSIDLRQKIIAAHDRGVGSQRAEVAALPVGCLH